MPERSAPSAQQVPPSDPAPTPATHPDDPCSSPLALEQARRELVIETIRRFGSARLQVAGTSMLPVIWPGDTLAIEAATIKDIHAGEVVVMERDSRLQIHRVLTISRGEITTQGDSLPRPDAVFLAEQLVGRVAGKVKGKEARDLPSWTRGRKALGRICTHSRWATLLLLVLAGKHRVEPEDPVV